MAEWLTCGSSLLIVVPGSRGLFGLTRATSHPEPIVGSLNHVVAVSLPILRETHGVDDLLRLD